MEKVWEIKDPDALLDDLATKRGTKQAARPRPDEKNPGKAYSLSMLHWGGGQLYNDQFKGAVFLTMMLFVIAATVFSVTYDDELLQFLHSRGISTAAAFLGAEVLLLCILLFWTYNAADAYYGSLRLRKTPFTGTPSRVFPVLGSIIVPGWGQFLNGQPVKGSIYTALAVLGIFSLLALVATLLVWPYLEPSDARFVVEDIFAVSLFVAPIFPPLWALSVLDAFKVSGDELKKEPLLERIKAAYYRGRSQGWVRGVFPHFRLTFLLTLLLVFFTIVIRYSFAKGFYTEGLMHIRSYLSSQGMTIIPELISNILDLLAHIGK
jgi:TM2 domain-containing membrane protein YozV